MISMLHLSPCSSCTTLQVDSGANVQPERVESVWNLRGILNTCWHRVRLLVTPSFRSLVVWWSHPCIAVFQVQCYSRSCKSTMSVRLWSATEWTEMSSVNNFVLEKILGESIGCNIKPHATCMTIAFPCNRFLAVLILLKSLQFPPIKFQNINILFLET